MTAERTALIIRDLDQAKRLDVVGILERSIPRATQPHVRDLLCALIDDIAEQEKHDAATLCRLQWQVDGFEGGWPGDGE